MSDKTIERCGTCKYFSIDHKTVIKENEGLLSTCNSAYFHTSNMGITVMSRTAVNVLVSSDFGCIYFEKMEKETD